MPAQPRFQPQSDIRLGNVFLANQRPLVLIAGPCVIESADHCLGMAAQLQDICQKLKLGWIFKASFDKANRTAVSSRRGVGEKEGLDILSRIREKYACPVLTDVHEPGQCTRAAEHVDILQIPAFLCRQTDLLTAAAQTKAVVNIKKGPFLAPWDMRHPVAKVLAAGNDRMMVTERGTSFGYNRLIADYSGLPAMKKIGCPVVFDASHSAQSPAGKGGESGGSALHIPLLAAAAASVGVAALFIETHDNPTRAHCDGDTSLPLSIMEAVLRDCLAHDQIRKSSPIIQE